MRGERQLFPDPTRSGLGASTPKAKARLDSTGLLLVRRERFPSQLSSLHAQVNLTRFVQEGFRMNRGEEKPSCGGCEGKRKLRHRTSKRPVKSSLRIGRSAKARSGKKSSGGRAVELQHRVSSQLGKNPGAFLSELPPILLTSHKQIHPTTE